MADYANTPFATFVQYIDSERQRQRQSDDADLDRRIALIHDMISAPGANPARTAEGIRGILELQGAKGGRGKRKGGLSGFMGQQEEVLPQFLSSLIHNEAPFQGPTYSTEQRTVQEPGFERNALSPLAPGQLPIQPKPPQFDGKSVLESPVMIPPEPIDVPPSGTPMLNAARQMQRQETIKTPLPQSQQPFMRSPDEMAEEEGHAAGVKAGAVADAQKASVIKQMRELGATDDEIKAALLQQLTGRSGSQFNMQDADAGFYTVNGQTRRAVRVFSPYTGAVQTLDALTRMPIPPDATPTAAPVAQHETDPTSYREYEQVKAQNDAVGKPTPTYDQWLTIDANRKRPTNTTNIVNPATGMTNQDRTAFNQIVGNFQRSPLMRAKDRLVTLEANIRQVAQQPANAAAQLALGYSFVQALDTYQSAVREGELRNLNTIDSKIGNLQLWAQQMTNGQLMRPEIAIQIAQAAAELQKAITAGYGAKMQQFRSQAAVNGLGAQWDQYVQGFGGGGDTTHPAAAQSHKVGDTTKARNGLVLYWDGRGWTDQPVVPPAPGGGMVQGNGIQR